ncbi:MAG: hypothetical protein INH41_13320 [Myxococcaceae bacterium]|nr:hypothetical protein [Myxococcaceae bacterium]MCA3013361.1 hypothetical protein [Myxococcaceae bacterium]
MAPPEGTGVAAPRADVTVRDVTVRQYHGSALRLEATAPVVELTRATNDFTAADASVRLTSSGVRVLAATAAGNGRAQVVTGSGGVRLLGVDGTVGDTPTATFDGALGTGGGAFSDAGVRIEHPRFTQTATGFVADFADERVTFAEPETTTKADTSAAP